MSLKGKDRLAFERSHLRQENAERLRRERMLLKDKLEQRKFDRKLAEEKRKRKTLKKKATKKFLHKLTPHLPKKKKQGGRLSRGMRIKLF